MLKLLAAARIVVVPVTVLGELQAGFELGQRTRENEEVLAEFLSEPFVSVRATTPDMARRYGQIFAQLKRTGTPLPVNDIWIAAAAIECSGQLITFDRHFERIEGLDCCLLT